MNRLYIEKKDSIRLCIVSYSKYYLTSFKIIKLPQKLYECVCSLIDNNNVKRK